MAGFVKPHCGILSMSNGRRGPVGSHSSKGGKCEFAAIARVMLPQGESGYSENETANYAFCDLPHLRTTNPIESVFATVRHRTVRTKGALSQKTAKLMVFTLIQAASKKWLRLNGRNQLPKVIEGIKFNDGVEVSFDAESRAA